MQLGIGAGVERALGVRLAWLTALRLAVLTLFLVLTTTLYPRGFVPGGFSARFAFITLGSGYFVAATYAVLLRRGRWLKRIAYAQLITDQLTWTAIVYVSGGVQSGATSLYGLTCLSGAILLGVSGGIVAVSAGAASLSALAYAFAAGLVLPPPDQPIDAYATRSNEIGYPLVVNLLGLLVVTVLAGYLAERLRTTGGRLEAATARAEEAERLAALGRLAAGLAHEIRNPLGSITGSIELLRTGGTLNEEDQELCAIVEREVRRLNDLVGDMLELSRPRAPQKELMDLATTVRDVVTLSGKIGRGGDVIVRYEGPERTSIVGDASQMRQVVWNLVRNAIQASSAGDTVKVRVRVDDDAIALEVEDNGPGISAEARARLFDAFFTTRSHGMGIGLAVVKRVVDDHGFVIEVDSREGRGTVFRVKMPVPDAETTSRRPAALEPAT